jgi:symplekin
LWCSLLARLYLEAPLITEEATELLKNMCGDETRAPVGLHLLQDLVIRRPPKQLTFINGLLLHTAHENSEVKYFVLLLPCDYLLDYFIMLC